MFTSILSACFLFFTLALPVVSALPVATTNEGAGLARRSLDAGAYDFNTLSRRGSGISRMSRTPEERERRNDKKEARNEYKQIGKDIKKEAKAEMGKDYKNGPAVHCANCDNDWEHAKAQKYAKQAWHENPHVQQYGNAVVHVNRDANKTIFHSSFHNGNQVPKATISRIKYHN